MRVSQTWICHCCFILCIAICTLSDAFGQPANSTEQQIVRFAIASDGDAIVIPGRVQDRRVLFWICTGSSVSLADSSFDLGKVDKTLRVGTDRGELMLSQFPTPQAAIGPIEIQNIIPHIAGRNMETIRAFLGCDIYVILGMDFLCKYIVRFNLDAGEMLLLPKLPDDPGHPLDLEFDTFGLPFTSVNIANSRETKMAIATDFQSLASGGLDTAMIKRLMASGDATLVGSGKVETAVGTFEERDVRCKSLRIGPIVLSDVVFSEGNSATLGMGFLSRFNVTFDFPSKRMYLQERKTPKGRDRTNVTGMGIASVDGKTVVHHVDVESPAAIAGFRAGDVLDSIDSKSASDLRLHTIREMLCEDGKTMHFTLRREGKVIERNLKPPPSK